MSFVDIAFAHAIRDAARSLVNDPRPRPFNKRIFYRNAADNCEAVQREELEAFARSRRWTIAPRSFPLSRLAPRYTSEHSRVIDHEEYLLSDRRPVAVLSHSYVPVDQIVEFADAHGLFLEFLPYSWYAPCHASAALFTRKSVKS